MFRYFFDIFDGRHWARDEEGEPFSSLEEVRRQATEDARELAAITLGRGERLDWRELRVRDEAGRDVLSLPFLEVVAGAI